jgi:hypothetical protein
MDSVVKHAFSVLLVIHNNKATLVVPVPTSSIATMIHTGRCLGGWCFARGKSRLTMTMTMTPQGIWTTASGRNLLRRPYCHSPHIFN